MTDVLLVAVDRSLVNRVAELGGHRVVSIDRDNVHGKHAGKPAETDFQPEVIFVGSGVSTDRAIEYASVIIGENPGVSVVLVAKRNGRLARRAAKAGIHRVIDERIRDRDLAHLLEHTVRATKKSPSVQKTQDPKQVPIAKQGPMSKQGPPAQATPAAGASHPHQVIVVASPKGGVGKTTTAVNVAALLAESAPGEVVVIDLDLQFGDVATVLDLAPAYTIADAFASGADDSMRLRTLLVPHPANFYVLCGSEDPAENGRVTGDQIRKLVHQYSASFRYVVIDTPAGLHEETLASLEEATDVVFVAALDVATLRAVRREIEVLGRLSLLPLRRHVMLNRTDRRSGLMERDAERIIGLAMDAVVPASDRISMAANRGELVVAAHKRNPVRGQFKDLTYSVADLSRQKGAVA